MKGNFLSVLMLLGVLLSGYGQMKQGHVHYVAEISAENGSDPNTTMMVEMMRGSTMDIYFDETRTRVDMSLGKEMFNSSSIVNGQSGEALMLMPNPMGKFAVRTTVKELELETDQIQGSDKQNIQLLEETKVIAGYNCKKAVLTNKEGGETTFWYTDQIRINTAGQSNLDDRVPGTSMETEIVENGIRIKYTAVKVSEDLGQDPTELFSTEVPDGFQEMSVEEFKNFGN